MTISQAETGFNERDMSIALGMAHGLTNKEIADLAGVSEKTVYNRREGANKPFIEQWAKFGKSLIREKKISSLELSKAQFERKLESLLGPIYEALEKAVEAGDAKLGMDIVKQMFGTKNLNVSLGRMEHVHIHQMDPAVTSAMDQMIAAGVIPTYLPPALLEGEVVSVIGSNVPADA